MRNLAPGRRYAEPTMCTTVASAACRPAAFSSASRARISAVSFQWLIPRPPNTRRVNDTSWGGWVQAGPTAKWRPGPQGGPDLSARQRPLSGRFNVRTGKIVADKEQRMAGEPGRGVAQAVAKVESGRMP